MTHAGRKQSAPNLLRHGARWFAALTLYPLHARAQAANEVVAPQEAQPASGNIEMEAVKASTSEARLEQLAQVTWTPNEAALTAARQANLAAQWAELEATQQDLEQRLEGEVRQARQAIEEAQAARRASAQQLTAAEEAYRVIRERYRYGRATNVDVADAETLLLSARLQRVNSWVDIHIAEIRLRHALGANLD